MISKVPFAWKSHSCHSAWPFNSMERRRCPSHQTNIYAMEAVGVVLPQGVSGGSSMSRVNHQQETMPAKSK